MNSGITFRLQTQLLEHVLHIRKQVQLEKQKKKNFNLLPIRQLEQVRIFLMVDIFRMNPTGSRCFSSFQNTLLEVWTPFQL